ncbi:flagellar basal body L-ring protein [Gammaproteobacteria bacterium 53_120_T64]|nr:flagellar basal body L-ring protein [Gammaproteobacteria bacterium 53_120_T64]
MKTAVLKRLQAVSALVAVSILSACTVIPEQSAPGYETVAPVAMVKPVHNTGSLYQTGYDMVLFEDQRASRVGDIIQVLLVEQMDAAKTTKTEIDKDSKSSVSAPTIFGELLDDLGLSLDSSSEFEGEGKSNQSNHLSGSIAVTVAEVLPNGNLVVQGEKWIQINQGGEFVRIKGIVRPSDVSSNNTVRSTLIANAKISYGGKGSLDEANVTGWVVRFFMSPLWPF